jgi:uncharacterized protein with HEPN domain
VSRDYRLYLDDILESSPRILEYSEHLHFKDFVGNKMAYDAILRNLEIIGEAAKNVPSPVRERYPKVEWRRIAGLRDVMAHTYYALDDETLWNIVQAQIPELREQVNEIIENEGNEQDDPPRMAIVK